jgi:hypothetical protein
VRQALDNLAVMAAAAVVAGGHLAEAVQLEPVEPAAAVMDKYRTRQLQHLARQILAAAAAAAAAFRVQHTEPRQPVVLV